MSNLPTSMSNEEMIARAVKELAVDVPVYSARISGNRVELHLYGGEVANWEYKPENAFFGTARPEEIVAELPSGSLHKLPIGRLRQLSFLAGIHELDELAGIKKRQLVQELTEYRNAHHGSRHDGVRAF